MKLADHGTRQSNVLNPFGQLVAGLIQPWRRPLMLCRTCTPWVALQSDGHAVRASSLRDGRLPLEYDCSRACCTQLCMQALHHGFDGHPSLLYLLSCRYVKAFASVLLVLGIITGAANMWCLGPINQQYIPKAVRQAEVVLQRKASPSHP